MIRGAQVEKESSSESEATVAASVADTSKSKRRRRSSRASPLVRNEIMTEPASSPTSSSSATSMVNRSGASAGTSQSQQPRNETVADTANAPVRDSSATSSRSFLETNCPICGETDRTKLQNCSRCRTVSYCTKEHQKLDFRAHKRLCIEIGRAQDSEEKQRLMRVLFNETVARIPETQPGKPVGNGAIKKILTKNHSNSKGQKESSSQNNAKNTESSDKNSSEGSTTQREDTRVNLHQKGTSDNELPITSEGSSEDVILESSTEQLNPYEDSKETEDSADVAAAAAPPPPPPEEKMPEQKPKVNGIKRYPAVQLDADNANFVGDRISLQEIDEISRNVIIDMDRFGVCVVNNFLGVNKGDMVLKEVMTIHNAGLFKDGQLVNSTVNDTRTVRGDKILWLDGKEKFAQNIGFLISKVDAIIMRANTMANNGKMGRYRINGRTKAMVACYPGHGSHYVKHVDNPNRDGRCITAIYYLNKHWCSATMGGLLRIFPDGWDQVANIEPVFDRILFFWSDRRNPHEVQPAFDTRYAITLWYFDAEERNEACRRYQRIQAENEKAKREEEKAKQQDQEKS